MIQLTDGAAAVVAVLASLVAVAWALRVAVRSAADGPEWAVPVLRRSYLGSLGALVVALGAVWVVRPVWAGFSVVYAAGVVAWLSGIVGRRLSRVLLAGKYQMPPPGRRAKILVKAAGGLLVAGFALAVVGVLISAPSGASLVLYLFATLLVGSAGLFFRRARSLIH